VTARPGLIDPARPPLDMGRASVSRPRSLLWQLIVVLIGLQLGATIALIVLEHYWLQPSPDALADQRLHSLDELRRAKLWTAACGVVLMATTLSGAGLIARRWRRDVETMATTSRRLFEGERGERKEVLHSAELASLAAELGTAVAGLRTQIQQLQAQRNEQQAIVQSMGSAVIALSREQRILSVNRAAERMLGFKSAAVSGRLLQDAIRQPALNRFVEAAMESAAGTRDEFELEGEQPIVIQATSEPLTDPIDGRVGLVILLNDVTELRRLESIRSDFAANVSHELRTPITNITGYVETMLQVGVDDPQRTRRFLETVKRNADRLAAIIEDLLALARLEHADTKAWLETQPTEAKVLVANVVSQFEAVAGAKSIALKSTVADGILVNVNARLVEQAISNLVSNAIKYSPMRTTVTLSADLVDENEAVIVVADEGPGIESRHLKRIFERFYRVDRARSRQLGGTGLGLAIVKHIALVHGGRIEVESKVGQGSTFRLALPRGDAAASMSAPASQAKQARS
jgi:two-component system phosphate regulon sensor histidine kinase PhoR